MFSKRIISALVLLVLAFSTCAAQRPNVVLILGDDLGYGDLSSYGAPDLKTPNIDAIGAAGMVFTGFYANSPVCSPTRAALLSGRYPDMVGVPGVVRTMERDSWGYLHPDETRDLIGEERDAYQDLAEDLRVHILAAGAVPWRRH